MWQVGTQGFKGSQQAQTLDEVTFGVFCLWVRTPAGVRIDARDLRSVTFHIAVDEVAETTITFSYDSTNSRVELESIGGLEIVYCDPQGNPLT